jgi:hypothetical protein
MSVSCECCVLSGRGLCVELISRAEESYRKCGVSECDRKASKMRRPWPTAGCYAMGKIYNIKYTIQSITCHTTNALFQNSPFCKSTLILNVAFNYCRDYCETRRVTNK